MTKQVMSGIVSGLVTAVLLAGVAAAWRAIARIPDDRLANILLRGVGVSLALSVLSLVGVLVAAAASNERLADRLLYFAVVVGVIAISCIAGVEILKAGSSQI